MFKLKNIIAIAILGLSLSVMAEEKWVGGSKEEAKKLAGVPTDGGADGCGEPRYFDNETGRFEYYNCFNNLLFSGKCTDDGGYYCKVA